MLRIFQYSFKQLLRNRAELFWLLLFPILLGTLFKAAFGSLMDETLFNPIPVAIVCGDGYAAEGFKELADALGEAGDDQFLIPTYCDEEKALALLNEKEVDGIIYADEDITLSVAANTDDTTAQSTLKCLVDQYNLDAAAITEIAMNSPELVADALSALDNNSGYTTEISFNSKILNTFDQYFYNLIAMSCLYTALSGMYIAINNQGNLSALGARKNVAPTHKLKLIAGELFSCIIFRFLINLIGFAYIVLVLKIDLTARLPLAILTIFVSCMAGTSLGFCLGSIGRAAENTKISVTIAFVMLCCFLSGLMVDNMRMYVEKYCPIINRINPAARISDCFYSLIAYDDLNRYIGNIITLLIFSAIFCFAGFLLTRRKKYASL